jgi:hypothetical protein
MGVVDVTFFDSHFANPVYGIRVYPLGYYALIFCFLDFYLTYRLTCAERSIVHLRNRKLDIPVTRAIWAFLVPIIVTLAISPNFLTVGMKSIPPEFPHRGLMENSLVAGLFCAAGTYIHNLRDTLDFSYVKNRKISEKARIEKLKVTHSSWSDALKLIVALYVGIAGVYLIYGGSLGLQSSGGNQAEAFARSTFGIVFTLFYSVFLAAGIIPQVLGGMSDIQEEFLNIRR